MTTFSNSYSTVRRHPAATTLLFGAMGFLCGFLLSLVLAAYSLYVCVQIS
jgi:hypothetical protein